MAGDRVLLQRATEALVAEERQKQHNVLAERLVEAMKTGGHPAIERGERSAASSLYSEIIPRRSLSELILPDAVRDLCRELIEEQLRTELLQSHGIEPRNRVMLVGPPGNGKTTLAEGIAEALSVPLFVVRYDGLIGSFLGETATRLRHLFDHARSRRCVLFFDEFDTVGKERGDAHETGEIKRVVSSLLMQIDSLPSHVVAVAASNHPELLDRAVWRRFQVRVELPTPTRAMRQDWFERVEKRFEAGLGMAPRTLADRLGACSFAELEEFSLDIMRRWILGQPEADIRSIARDRLKFWQLRSEARSTATGG